MYYLIYYYMSEPFVFCILFWEDVKYDKKFVRFLGHPVYGA